MVSASSLLFMIITLLLSLFLPVGFLLILQKGRRGVFSVWIAGALGFFLPQIVIRLSLLQLLGSRLWFQDFADENPYVFAFLIAASAALFETTGRLIVLKFVLSKRLSYMTGLAAGAGHGGIEAVYLIGLTYINNIVISFFINANKLSVLIPDNPELADSIRQTMLETSPHLFLLAGVERVFIMVLHIALSVLLALCIIKKHPALGFLLVSLMHFLVDFIVTILQLNRISFLIIEGMLLLVALVSLVFVVKIRPRFGDNMVIPIDPGEQAVNEGY
jgi:uncharacterized membrane protein YhfC